MITSGGQFTYGGSSDDYRMMVYNFAIDDWTIVNADCTEYKPWRCYKPGVCWSHSRDTMYSITRGNAGFYNMVKNKWYKFVKTNLYHEDGPLLWFDEMNDNVLNIASTLRDGMEYIDLRMDCKWTVKYQQKVTNGYGITIRKGNPMSPRFGISTRNEFRFTKLLK